MASTRENIILVRKQETSRQPKLQIISNKSRWYRNQSQEAQDRDELDQLIAQAREARLSC